MKSTIHRLLSCLALACLLYAAAAGAEAPRLYDVEIVVFSHLDGAADGEHLRVATAPPEANGRFPEGEFTELAPEFYTLNNIRNALASWRGYRVLFHRAWRQLGYDQDHAVAYPVHTIASRGQPGVDGSVSLVRERYLHLDVDLALLMPGNDTSVQYSDAPGNVPMYRLTEKRRIRSSKLYYFDHPRFGVIAKVTPVTSTGEEATPEDAGTDDTAPQDAGGDSAGISSGEGDTPGVESGEQPVAPAQ